MKKVGTVSRATPVELFKGVAYVSQLVINDFAYLEHPPLDDIDSPLYVDIVPRPRGSLEGARFQLVSAVSAHPRFVDG